MAVAGLPSSPVAVTVAVYFFPYSSAPSGSQLAPSAASFPSTALPASSVSATVVSFASLAVKTMPVEAGTSVASAFGSVIVALAFGAACSPPPCQLDGLSPPEPVQAEVRASAAARTPPRAPGVDRYARSGGPGQLA